MSGKTTLLSILSAVALSAVVSNVDAGGNKRSKAPPENKAAVAGHVDVAPETSVGVQGHYAVDPEISAIVEDYKLLDKQSPGTPSGYSVPVFRNLEEINGDVEMRDIPAEYLDADKSIRGSLEASNLLFHVGTLYYINKDTQQYDPTKPAFDFYVFQGGQQGNPASHDHRNIVIDGKYTGVKDVNDPLHYLSVEFANVSNLAAQGARIAGLEVPGAIPVLPDDAVKYLVSLNTSVDGVVVDPANLIVGRREGLTDDKILVTTQKTQDPVYDVWYACPTTGTCRDKNGRAIPHLNAESQSVSMNDSLLRHLKLEGRDKGEKYTSIEGDDHPSVLIVRRVLPADSTENWLKLPGEKAARPVSDEYDDVSAPGVDPADDAKPQDGAQQEEKKTLDDVCKPCEPCTDKECPPEKDCPPAPGAIECDPYGPIPAPKQDKDKFKPAPLDMGDELNAEGPVQEEKAEKVDMPRYILSFGGEYLRNRSVPKELVPGDNVGGVNVEFGGRLGGSNVTLSGVLDYLYLGENRSLNTDESYTVGAAPNSPNDGLVGVFEVTDERVAHGAGAQLRLGYLGVVNEHFAMRPYLSAGPLVSIVNHSITERTAQEDALGHVYDDENAEVIETRGPEASAEVLGHATAGFEFLIEKTVGITPYFATIFNADGAAFGGGLQLNFHFGYDKADDKDEDK